MWTALFGFEIAVKQKLVELPWRASSFLLLSFCVLVFDFCRGAPRPVSCSSAQCCAPTISTRHDVRAKLVRVSISPSSLSLTHTHTRARSLPLPIPSSTHPVLGVGATWMLHSFWHICYFGMLVAIALIWKPSPVSDQLSYSFQLATSEDEADHIDGITYDLDDSDEVEMVDLEDDSVDKDLSS